MDLLFWVVLSVIFTMLLLYFLRKYSHEWKGEWSGTAIEVHRDGNESYLQIGKRKVASGPVGTWLSGEIPPPRGQASNGSARILARAKWVRDQMTFEVHVGGLCLTEVPGPVHARSAVARSLLDDLLATGDPELRSGLDDLGHRLDAFDRGWRHVHQLHTLGVDVGVVETELLTRLEPLEDLLARAHALGSPQALPPPAEIDEPLGELQARLAAREEVSRLQRAHQASSARRVREP